VLDELLVVTRRRAVNKYPVLLLHFYWQKGLYFNPVVVAVH